ncbi:hypothetical protein PG994_010732 [Apiospora phragmitis]|uniref:Dihydrodipicolinate synthase n=1 Tax=Apiospora phragmitis TaxID=2905665 RepID=A0ABR1TQZ9_9PEZI
MSSSRISEPKAKPLPAGVWTPVITLYDDTPEQGVDHGAMYKHCQHLVRSGMHGLVYLGTNGELALLTRAERQAVLRNARQAVADLVKADYHLVAGISAQSTAETVQLAREAAEAGAGWGLLLPPSYWAKALPTEALLAYFRDVADASPIPTIVYNLAALASNPKIVATKLTCGNVGKLTRLTSKFAPAHFGVYGGSSDYLLPTLHAGGHGCVTGLGNVFPRATSAVYDLWTAGRLDEARALQDKVANAEWACKKGIAQAKYGAWWFVGRKGLGLENENLFRMRKPYLPLGDDAKKWTVETMRVLEARGGGSAGRQ